MEQMLLVHKQSCIEASNTQENQDDLLGSTYSASSSVKYLLPRFVSYSRSYSQQRGTIADILQKDFRLPEDFRTYELTQDISTCSIALNEEQRDDIMIMLNCILTDSWKYRHPRLEELNILLSSYLQYFHMQHPILHIPTIIISLSRGEAVLKARNTILIYAMCCAGGFVHPLRSMRECAVDMQELLRRALDYYIEETSLEYMQAWHLSNYIGGWSGNVHSMHSWSAFHSAIDVLRTKLQISSFVSAELCDIPLGEQIQRWVRFRDLGAFERLIVSQFELECQLAAFANARHELKLFDLSLSVSYDKSLWEAATAEDWASLWNSQLWSTQLRQSQYFDLSASGLFRNFSRYYKDTHTAWCFALGMQYEEEYKLLLLGIYEFVVSLVDAHALLDSNVSESVRLQRHEAVEMLEYWLASFDAFVTIERAKHVSLHIRLLFHMIALTLYFPNREIRKASERNCVQTLVTAIASAWSAWNIDDGKQAMMGLWHAGQIIRLTRDSVLSIYAPPWILAPIMEAANVMCLAALPSLPRRWNALAPRAPSPSIAARSRPR